MGNKRNIPALHPQARVLDTTSGGCFSLAEALDTTELQPPTRKGQCEPNQEQQVPRRIVNNVMTPTAAATNDSPISC